MSDLVAGSNAAPSAPPSAAAAVADDSSHHLVIVIKEAHGLAARDANGSSDPYVVLEAGGHKLVTKVVSRSLAPSWNEFFELRAVKASETFVFNVWDSDTVFEPLTATHDPSKQNHTPAAKLRQAVKNRVASASAAVFSKADDFLGRASLSVATVLELVASGKSETWLKLESDGKSQFAVTGELCIGFERRVVAKDAPGIVQSAPGVAPGVAPGPDAGAAALAQPAAIADDSVVVGAVHFLPIEFVIDDTVETFIELRDGPRVKWQGRTVKEIIAVAGEPLKATLHIRVRAAHVDMRSIFLTFKGKAARGGSQKETIVRLQTDLLRAFVTAGQLAYGAHGAAADFVRFARGKHALPFELVVPPHAPTTVSCGNTTIAYELKSLANVTLLGDKTSSTEVLVLNVASTPAGRAPRTFEQSIKLTASPLSMTIRADADAGVPFTDVKISATVANLSAVLPVSKVTVEVYQVVCSDIKQRLSETKIVFRPPIAQGSERTAVLFFEIPDLAPSVSYKGVSVAYELRFVARAAGRDASLSMSLVVQARDPKIKAAKLEIDRLAKLTPSPAQWSARDLHVFLKDELKLDDAVADFFRLRALDGTDLLALFDPRAVALPASLLAAAPGWPADKAVAELVFAAVWRRLRPSAAVSFLLKRLMLTEFEATIVQQQRLTIDQLCVVRVQDLAKAVPLGVALAVTDGAKEWVAAEKRLVVSQ